MLFQPPFSGGLGEAVAGALSTEPGVSVTRMAVQGVPRSGKPDELMALFQIDAAAIVAKVKALVGCA